MDYNSTRGKLLMPEYGRNVQKMIDYAISLEDREKRSRLANVIVQIMMQLYPNQREVGDLKHKLWDHLFIISDFKLDVDAPYPMPSPQVLKTKPERIPYRQNNITFRYYGKNIGTMLDKATEYPEGPEKELLIKTIANHMKKSYLTWNREAVDDVLIGSHIKQLSKDKLKLSEEITLNNTSDILARNKKKKFVGNRPRNNNSSNQNRGRRKN